MQKVTPILAIVIIGALAAYAMHLGINGVLLAGVFAIVAGLGGYIAPHRKTSDKPKSEE